MPQFLPDSNYNKAIHDQIANVYNLAHAEIYNLVEQNRIDGVIDELIAKTPGNGKPKVLDFGSGTGNLSLKFLAKGCEVTACDVSPKSLKQLERKSLNGKALRTVVLTGPQLPFDSDSFDIVATYSVLHHIPDYLFSVTELIRVCKTNGLVYIDHERNNNYWFPDDQLKEWQKKAQETIFDQIKRVIKTKELLTLGLIKSLFIRLFINKRHHREGDLHVWPDDHIEWQKIVELAKRLHCEIEKEEDFLLFSPKVGINEFNLYRTKCTDTRYVFLRKK